MQKPNFRTISRFKAENNDLIENAFKNTVKIAKKKNDLIKIHHVSLDGTKIKAKTSINNLTNKKQIKIIKKHLKKSIKLDIIKNQELKDNYGNNIPESLTNKEKFEKTINKINKTSKNDKNKNKLRTSSKKLLKQAEKGKKENP